LKVAFRKSKFNLTFLGLQGIESITASEDRKSKFYHVGPDSQKEVAKSGISPVIPSKFT